MEWDGVVRWGGKVGWDRWDGVGGECDGAGVRGGGMSGWEGWRSGKTFVG